MAERPDSERRPALRRRLRARALAAATRAAAVVPAPLVQAGLAGAAGLARFSTHERRTLANLALALGAETSPAERRRIARGVRRHAARLFAEWLRLAQGGAPGTPSAARGAWIDAAVEIDGSLDLLRGALARGRGALVVTAHLGNWELGCARLARLGLAGAVVGRHRPGDPSAGWIEAVRRAYGVRTLPQSASPRALLAVLRRGEVLGLLADLEVRRLAGVFVPFFGVPALTMTAPAALARASGAPIVPMRCAACAGGRYRLSFEAPLEARPGLARAEATRELTVRLNALFEGWIRQAPEQWAWHQPRWRTRPGEHVPLPLAARRARRKAPAGASLRGLQEGLDGP